MSFVFFIFLFGLLLHTLDPRPVLGRFLHSFFFCFVSHFEGHCARRTLVYFGAAHALPSERLEVCPLLFTSLYLSSVVCVVLPVLLLPAFSSPVRFFRSLSRECSTVGRSPG